MFRAVCLLAFVAVIAIAGQPWSKNPEKWSKRDAERILNVSPWAHRVQVRFPAPARIAPQMSLPGAEQAGMGGRDAYSGKNWDGGVQRNPRNLPGVPELSVLVRWGSALPVREALQKADEPLAPRADESPVEKYYIITVIGLVPAGVYESEGEIKPPATTSESGDDENAPKKRNPEPMLEGLMADSMLATDSGISIRPENVKLDAATGALQFFFPRTKQIAPGDGEAIFETKFSIMTIKTRFRLKDMVYRDNLAL